MVCSTLPWREVFSVSILAKKTKPSLFGGKCALKAREEAGLYGQQFLLLGPDWSNTTQMRTLNPHSLVQRHCSWLVRLEPLQLVRAGQLPLDRESLSPIGWNFFIRPGTYKLQGSLCKAWLTSWKLSSGRQAGSLAQRLVCEVRCVWEAPIQWWLLDSAFLKNWAQLPKALLRYVLLGVHIFPFSIRICPQTALMMDHVCFSCVNVRVAWLPALVPSRP